MTIPSLPVSALLFIYLLFKLGICQCIGRSLCKMCWVSCEVCRSSLEYIITNLWYRIINTKRVYRGRRRFRDVELGYNSSSSTDDDNENNYYHHHYSQAGRKREWMRGRRRRRRRHLSLSSRLEGRRSWRLRSSRQVQLSKARRNRHGGARISKRRRIH